MRQLQSPPTSARALAKWLMEEFHAPSRPLASLHLLISEPAPAPLLVQRGGTELQLQPAPADFATVQEAIREWSTLSAHTDDLMLFFFCDRQCGRDLE